MSSALQKAMTIPDFLAWEERQELCWEFDGFEPVAMTGGTFAPEVIGGSLRALLAQQLRGKACRVLGPTMKIEVAGRIRYPDAFVSCTPVALDATVAKDPVVVFEVLSPSPERTDRFKKLREYQGTPSIQRYVMLESTEIGVWDLTRHGDEWVLRGLDVGDTLDMPEIGVAIAVSDVYAELDLGDAASG